MSVSLNCVLLLPINLTKSFVDKPSTLPDTVTVPLAATPVVTALDVWKAFAGTSIVKLVPVVFAFMGNSFLCR